LSEFAAIGIVVLVKVTDFLDRRSKTLGLRPQIAQPRGKVIEASGYLVRQCLYTTKWPKGLAGFGQAQPGQHFALPIAVD
jgi:hypothetical protein